MKNMFLIDKITIALRVSTILNAISCIWVFMHIGTEVPKYGPPILVSMVLLLWALLNYALCSFFMKGIDRYDSW